MAHWGLPDASRSIANDDDNEVNKNDDTKHPVSFVEMRLKKYFPIEKKFQISDLKKRHIKARF